MLLYASNKTQNVDLAAIFKAKRPLFCLIWHLELRVVLNRYRKHASMHDLIKLADIFYPLAAGTTWAIMGEVHISIVDISKTTHRRAKITLFSNPTGFLMAHEKQF
jgi:hypothetical protein